MNHSYTYLRFLLLIFIVSNAFYACSQDSTKMPLSLIQDHQYSFGSSSITVRETSYKTEIPIQFLQLHSNETTADKTTTLISNELGINYTRILNGKERLIELKANNATCRFDPNRVFSKEGIVASLQLHSRYTDKCYKATENFSKFILNLLDTSKIIVAVHNNTDSKFSLGEYVKNNTGMVHQNQLHDPDDFFITTDSSLFRLLKEKDFNVVLEYSKRLKDDGSLSIYCSRNNIRYVNVEAEHGHEKEQAEMLRALIGIIKH